MARTSQHRSRREVEARCFSPARQVLLTASSRLGRDVFYWKERHHKVLPLPPAFRG